MANIHRVEVPTVLALEDPMLLAVVEAAAERAAWAAARESAADEDYRDAWDLYTPDFPEDV